MNVHLQISIDEETQLRAEAKAAKLGMTLEDYIRRAINELGRPELQETAKPDISIFFDLGASEEPTDIAHDKDKMVGEAVWKEYLRKTGQKGTS